MQPVTRRTAFQAMVLSVIGGAVTDHIPGVKASEHDPPSEDDVNVPVENAIYVEASPDDGFHYPYFLYIPPGLETDTAHERPLLIEPNNTPSSEDGFEPQLEAGKNILKGSSGKTIADELDLPFLIPLFPRYREEPEPWYVYVQVLDQSTFILEDSPLERVDLQLLAMVDDAAARLEEDGYRIPSEVHLDGFSASSNFVNRFTFIHPNRVNAVSNGGDGKFMLPKPEIDEDVPVVIDPQMDELPYPVGVADMEELTGEPFDKDAWITVPQFLYTGGEDQPDPDESGYRSFGNLYDEEVQYVHPDDRPYGLPDLIEDLFGIKQVDERFEVSRAVYNNVEANAQFTIYEGYGHTPEPAFSDLIKFHRRHMHETYGPQFDVSAGWFEPEIVEGEPFEVTITYENLGATTTPAEPALTVDGAVVDTATVEVEPGETVSIDLTHTVDEPGTYSIDIDDERVDLGELEVTADTPDNDDEEDDTDDASQDTPVGDDVDDDEEDDDGNDDVQPETPEPDDLSHGFGIASTVVGIAGAGYYLNRRRNADTKR